MNVIAIAERHAGQFAAAQPTPKQAGINLPDEPALGVLAMSIVHDLRNPLAAIHSGAEMLYDSHLPEQQVRRLARNMYTASVRIQDLLEDYVELCRTRQSRRDPSNLRTLVAQAVDRIAFATEAHSVVVVQDIPADLVIAVDRRRIGSVFANLFANALEVMRDGGSIRISAVAEEGSVVIKVLDTGPGVAPELRDRLFQPFATAGKQNGWGFGLAHARQVVIDHGGDMWLDSSPGRGACFVITLPASPRVSN